MTEDERNTAPYGTALYLQNEVRAYHLRRARKEANNAKLGKGKGRSGGRAVLKRDRKANNTEKGNKAERCTVGRGTKTRAKVWALRLAGERGASRRGLQDASGAKAQTH